MNRRHQVAQMPQKQIEMGDRIATFMFYVSKNETKWQRSTVVGHHGAHSLHNGQLTEVHSNVYIHMIKRS
jgi:hypothetical protein